MPQMLREDDNVGRRFFYWLHQASAETGELVWFDASYAYLRGVGIRYVKPNIGHISLIVPVLVSHLSSKMAIFYCKTID